MANRGSKVNAEHTTACHENKGKTMSHTPGPWAINYNGTIGHIKSLAKHPRGMTPTVARFDGQLIAQSIEEDESKANANLMAASPDLLKACKDVLAALEKATQKTGEILWLDHVLPGVHESAMERLQNVIDDAEGRSKACLDCGEKFVGPTELCDACLDERDRIDEVEKARG